MRPTILARVLALAALALLTTSVSGCLVAGYSSTGGAFLWPGGFGLIVILLLAYFFLRGRR